MKPFANFSLDKDPVRFTGDGKIFVLDAISELSETDQAKIIWDDLKNNTPEIIQYVEYHSITEDIRVPITGSKGWNKIQTLLFDYLIDTANQ